MPFRPYKAFDSHESARQHRLHGKPLASFRARAVAFAVDLLLLNVVTVLVSTLVAHYLRPAALREPGVRAISLDTWWALAIFVAYFATCTYLGSGQTPGKRLLRIRVVSLLHERIGLWHSIERALGYVASTLELGFGFWQYFIHPNAQTVHDRIAETVVLEEPPKA